MKTMKKILSLMLVLAMTISLCACGASSSVTKAEIAQIIEDASEVARSAGYFEGLNKGMQYAENYSCDCNCPSCSNSNPTNAPENTANNPDSTEAEPEVIKAEHLPILMTYTGTWLDQNGDPISYADAERFFKHNREYAKVAVAINNLCEELQSDAYRYDLERVYDWATASPHDTDEYLTYEWVLSEMEANYDNYLNDLLTLISDQIDFDSSPAANVATCIILEKMLEFRDDGTYEASINPHRKHDCEAEGCRTNTTVVTMANKPVPTTDKGEVDYSSMTGAEIIAYLDKQNAGPATQFDLQHPTIYFDRFGYVHGTTDADEERYFATFSGNVYKLNKNTDIDRLSQTGEGSLSDMSLHGTYVGTTNRRIK